MSRFAGDVVDNIKGFFKGADTRAFRLSAEEGDNFVNALKDQGYDVKGYGDVAIVNTSQLSSQAKRNLEEIKVAFKADAVYDAGSIMGGGVTWKKILVVAGGVVVAIVLINPKTGAALGNSVAGATQALIEPFIPSAFMIIIPCCLLLSSALAAIGVSQRLR